MSRKLVFAELDGMVGPAMKVDKSSKEWTWQSALNRVLISVLGDALYHFHGDAAAMGCSSPVFIILLIN